MTTRTVIEQVAMSLGVYRDRGEWNGKDVEQAHECLDRAGYELSEDIKAAVRTIIATAPKGWGLAAPWGTKFHWSARTILRAGAIDVVWDRCGWEGTYADNEHMPLAKWVDEKALPYMRHLAAHGEDFPYGSEDREVVVKGDGFVLRANPRASHGYLYLSAEVDPTATEKTPSVPKPRKPRARKTAPSVSFDRRRGRW